MASAPAAPASGAASATTTPPTATATATVEPTLIGTEESESSDSSASDNDDGSSSTAQQQHQDAPRAGRAMPEGLSKSGQRKWELIEQRRLLRKDKRRERKERRKRKRDAAHRDSTTADAAAAQHTQPPSAKRRRVIEIAPDAQRIVIDCNWCDVMTPKELTAMVQQIVHSYAVNSRADVPCNLTVSSFCGAIKQDIDYSHPSHTNWKGITLDERSYLDLFPKDELVYLTADSPHTLSGPLEKSKVYVIGGLVDHNRLKGISYERAQQAGVTTAKFPISEHLSLLTRHVLAVNHVLDILLRVGPEGNWRQALVDVIPARKFKVQPPNASSSVTSIHDDDGHPVAGESAATETQASIQDLHQQE